MPTLQQQQLQAIAATAKDAQELLSSYMQLKQTGEPLPDDGQELLDTLDTLYDLHSAMYAATRDSKQETANAKSAMDEKHIGLQNVMYEKRHLLEEIVKCRAFRSLYQDVELVPIEEFHARAPKEYLENQDNPHQLMINRLKFEQMERTSLREQQEKLQAERLALIRENRKAQEKLDRFDKLLDDFVQAATPLEEALQEEEKKATTTTTTSSS
ncbi:hypothetical protein LRAMOSA08181 [Lichtheimia ramosa]|uniref:THO complex subunit 5 n=1 Tax=Lichtheimia ramosa TaxID=688394 RepID=A0A077WEW0_9FUNG|nr:hypothetical protein LRAMOSA08181 [Lichtheimia ramosa]